jgi:hypothetical protein
LILFFIDSGLHWSQGRFSLGVFLMVRQSYIYREMSHSEIGITNTFAEWLYIYLYYVYMYVVCERHIHVVISI